MSALAKKRQRDGELMFNKKKLMLQAIPLNTQKFKVLRLNNVTLLDSMSFLNDSLERLVDNLKISNHPFTIVRQWLPKDDERELIMRKGVYPYEYMTSMEKLQDKQLPPRAAFASKLSGTTEATVNDYDHAKKVWSVFKCNNLEDFSRLYVRADCYQLMEAVLELRATMYEEFTLDLCHYLSLPMMAKECMLKYTGAELELLHDDEMIHMIKDNIR